MIAIFEEIEQNHFVHVNLHSNLQSSWLEVAIVQVPSEKLKVTQPIFDRATLSDNNKRDFATKEDLIDRNRYFLFYRLYLIILLISLIINELGFFLSRNVHIRNIFCKIWVFVFEISSFSLSGCFPYLLVRWHVTSKAQLSTYIL